MSNLKKPCEYCEALTIHFGNNKICEKCQTIIKHASNFMKSKRGRYHIIKAMKEHRKSDPRNCFLGNRTPCSKHECAMWDMFQSQCIIRTVIIRIIAITNKNLKGNK